jgi:hypothetical protein
MYFVKIITFIFSKQYLTIEVINTKIITFIKTYAL